MAQKWQEEPFQLQRLSDREAPMNEPALAGGVRVVVGAFSAAEVIA